ncbi:MAG: hemerythrin domain-containing protein [Lysobacterales bacterium]
MTQPGEWLTAQHRRIDDGVGGAGDGAGGLAALAESLASLRAHIHAEETVLFPPLEQAGLAMPVFVMKREHGQMWPLLVELAAACTAAAPVESVRGPARQLFQLLQIHNAKEEQIVYAAADRLVAERGDETLMAALAGARVPGDWICALAPR